jgi:hypothetical protein
MFYFPRTDFFFDNLIFFVPDLINPLMTVIEKAFKAKLPSGQPCPVVIERAFK